MNICLFFEGTGKGIAGEFTNVSRLQALCVKDSRQKIHLEPGCGTRFGALLSGRLAGSDWRIAFRRSKRWFERNIEKADAGPDGAKIYLFGFSRGALIARHFADWLRETGRKVEFLGIWDTVDSTIGLDVAETCPSNVNAARHAVARDETRKFFRLVPLKSGGNRRVKERLFPGSHSDIGGLYEDEHSMADLTLAWIGAGADYYGVRFRKGTRFRQELDVKAVKLHDSHSLASNLWGAFERTGRNVSKLIMHPACRALGKTRGG